VSRNNRGSRFKRKGKGSGGQGSSGIQTGRLRIVSNAQTGITRGFLDAALEQEVDCGGYCVEGRMSEDGFIPDHYPVEELEGSDTSDTIRRNVKDSDGTAIIFFGEIEDEPEEALDCCVQQGKPYRLVDALELQPGQAAKTIADFIKDKGLISLNIVGTKLSLSEKAQRFGFEAARTLLGNAKKSNPKRHTDKRPQNSQNRGDAPDSDTSGSDSSTDEADESKTSNNRSGPRRRNNSGRRFRRKPPASPQTDSA
jgi:hypothetical protein